MSLLKAALLKGSALLVLICSVSALDITGTEFVDSSDSGKLVGGNEITASINDDNINLLGGGDLYIYLDAGNDYLNEGPGNDTRVYAGPGNDVIIGGEGVDSNFDGNDGDDVIRGGPGNDGYLRGFDDDDTLDGGPGNDKYFFGGNGNDKIYGGEGDDYNLAGDMNNDIIKAGPGDDFLLNGGLNDDVIYGGPGDDTQIYGGSGNDNITGNDGDDAFYGGDGNDFLTGGAGNDTLGGDAGSDTFVLGENDGFDVAPSGGFVVADDTLSIPVTAELTVQEAGPDTILRVGNSAFKLTGVIDTLEADLNIVRTPVMSPTSAPTPKGDAGAADQTGIIIGATVASVGVLAAVAVILYRRQLIAEDALAEEVEEAMKGP